LRCGTASFCKAALCAIIWGRLHHKDANTKFRCAKTIELLPGFETKTGADFEAYIQGYDCCMRGDGEYKITNNVAFTMDPIIGGSYVNNELPEDSLGNYEPTEGELEADSLNIINTLLDIEDGEFDYTSWIELSFGSDQDNGSNKQPVINDEPIIQDLLNGIKLYPNPNEANFTGSLLLGEMYNLRLINSLGQLVYSNDNCKDNHEVSETNLSNGNYLLQIINDKDNISKKVVISK